MAMNGDTLGMAIATAVLDSGASAAGKAQCEEFWKKVANEIVSHIQQNAKKQAYKIHCSDSAAEYIGQYRVELEILNA